MRKLAKKVLAICLSAVMAGTMLSAVAFATEPEAASDNEYGIATLDSATVISKNTSKTDWSYSGDVYIEKGVTLSLSGTCTISGNVYDFGTILNSGVLTVTGTLHCLYYYNGIFTGSAGNYNYGYFYDYGTLYYHVLDITPGWLEDTVIPETSDDGDDDNDGNDGDGDSGTEIPSGTHVTVISGEETFNDQEITGDVVIPKDTTLTTSGDVSIDGDVYVLGTLINTGTLDITGTLYCLHYNSMLSAGDYDYGYVYNEGELNGHDMIVNDSYLSNDFPTSTVHVWGEIEWSLNEDGTSGTATRTCLVCGETETVDVDVSEETIETEDGETETVVTETADFDGDEVTIESVVDEDEDEDTTKDNGSTSTGSNGTDSTGTTGTGSTSTGSTGSTGTGSTGTGSTGSTGTGSTGTGSSGNSGTSSSSRGSTATSPQTDDSTNTTALWLIVACFGLAGCVALTLYKVRGTKEQN